MFQENLTRYGRKIAVDTVFLVVNIGSKLVYLFRPVDGGDDAAQRGEVDIVRDSNPIELSPLLILQEDIGDPLGIRAVGDGVRFVVKKCELGHFLSANGVVERVNGAVALS